jgi:hypothetical protein
MQVDPSAKKILDVRFAKGEIDREAYLASLKTLHDSVSLESAAPNSEAFPSDATLLWDRFPPLCDANFDGEINHVKEPCSALRQLALLDQTGCRNFFKLTRRETADSLEVRSFSNTFLLLFTKSSPLLTISGQCSEEIAISMLYRIYAEDYQSFTFIKHLQSLSLSSCDWPAK